MHISLLFSIYLLSFLTCFPTLISSNVFSANIDDLNTAIRHRDLQQISDILKGSRWYKPVEPNAIDSRSDYPLIIATDACCPECALLLINHGITYNNDKRLGYSPLVGALRNCGKLPSTLPLYLEHYKQHINTFDQRNETPLHHLALMCSYATYNASKSWYSEAIHLLLKNGADPFLPTPTYQNTILSFVSNKNCLHFLTRLYIEGVDIFSYFIHPKEKHLTTIIHYSIGTSEMIVYDFIEYSLFLRGKEYNYALASDSKGKLPIDWLDTFTYSSSGFDKNFQYKYIAEIDYKMEKYYRTNLLQQIMDPIMNDIFHRIYIYNGYFQYIDMLVKSDDLSFFGGSIMRLGIEILGDNTTWYDQWFDKKFIHINARPDASKYNASYKYDPYECVIDYQPLKLHECKFTHRNNPNYTHIRFIIGTEKNYFQQPEISVYLAILSSSIKNRVYKIDTIKRKNNIFPIQYRIKWQLGIVSEVNVTVPEEDFIRYHKNQGAEQKFSNTYYASASSSSWFSSSSNTKEKSTLCTNDNEIECANQCWTLPSIAEGMYCMCYTNGYTNEYAIKITEPSCLFYESKAKLNTTFVPNIPPTIKNKYLPPNTHPYPSIQPPPLVSPLEYIPPPPEEQEKKENKKEEKEEL